MPRLRQVVPDLVDLGGDVVGNILARRSVGRAGQVLTAGVDSAGRRISDATGTAVDTEQAALDRQEGLYGDRRRILSEGLDEQRDVMDTRRSDFQPYADAGREGVTALRDLNRENPMFDASKVGDEAGYAFGRDEGMKEVQRILSARGTLNSGQVKGLIRYANDYATTKVNDAEGRFNRSQQARFDRINALAGYGERSALGQANASGDYADQLGNTSARESDAAGDFGDQIGRNATNRSALALAEADALANLDVSRANVEAGTKEARSDASGRLLDTAVGVGGGLLRKALGGAAATAGTVAGIAAPAAADVAATTATMASLGIGFPGAAPAATTAASGGLGSTLAGLATNPVTIGVAAALAVGAIWLKSQAHFEANEAVSTYENPFHKDSLAPFAKQWNRAVKSGQVNAQQGAASLDQYIQNFEDYTNRIEEWAGNSKDKMKVAAQSIANLYKTTVQPQIARMRTEIAGLPA